MTKQEIGDEELMTKTLEISPGVWSPRTLQNSFIGTQ